MTAAPLHAQNEATVTVLDPLTAEIIEALRYFRGVSHRGQVIDYIKAAHRTAGRSVNEDLGETVIATFERQLGLGRDDPRPFRLPFGPTSHRWALSDAAMKG